MILMSIPSTLNPVRFMFLMSIPCRIRVRDSDVLEFVLTKTTSKYHSMRQVLHPKDPKCLHRVLGRRV